MKKNLQIKHCLWSLIFLSIQVSLFAQDQTSIVADTSFSVDSLYHYWIKFPADTQATCLGQIEVPGLEYEEKGCDLLATGYSDNFFTAAGDSSCYKILRTYRIINWCEYNGQAAPVVVSRDWDNWHGTNPGRCNPAPDGNNRPGDSDLYVYIKRDFNDNKPDTVWYDADADPHNNIPDDTLTTDIVEGYWWRVISGSANRNEEAYYEGNCSTWAYDNDSSDSDISGNIAQDDADERYGSFGYWLYTQHITVYDDVAPTIELGGPDTFLTTTLQCGASVLIPVAIFDSCSTDQPTIRLTLDINNDGDEDGDVTVLWDGNNFFTSLGIGEHRLKAEAFDNCGNRTEVEKIFSVVDGVAPTPICHEGLVAEIGEGADENQLPAAIVWASDLIASNTFDCTGQADTLREDNRNLVTTYSINRVGSPVDQAQNSLAFFCGEQDSLIQVEIHAWDESGNHDFCTTEIEVQDNINTCSAPVDFSGVIQTPDGEPFPNVEVQVSGGINFTVQTNEQGRFDIRILRSSENVSINPSIETDPAIGISTADLIRIQKHIVGNQPFETPYELLAADLDNNGRINFRDLIRVRKTILGMEDPTAYNKNWLFIPTNFAFQDPASPWSEVVPDKLVVDGNMNFSQYETNFWAVKIGDANGSAVRQVEGRSQQKAQLLLPNKALESGQTYEIPIYLKDEQLFDGCQFALTWDTEAIEIMSATTTSEQSAIYLDAQSRNHLKVSWLNTTTTPNSDKRIGTLKIRAKQTTDLSQTIVIGDRYLTAEAYLSAFELQPLEIEFQSPSIDWSISEHPFRVSSRLQFSEQISGPLSIFDRSGRLVWQTILNHANQVEIRKTDLGAAGTYFFQINHKGKQMTGQLISID